MRAEASPPGTTCAPTTPVRSDYTSPHLPPPSRADFRFRTRRALVERIDGCGRRERLGEGWGAAAGSQGAAAPNTA